MNASRRVGSSDLRRDGGARAYSASVDARGGRGRTWLPKTLLTLLTPLALGAVGCGRADVREPRRATLGAQEVHVTVLDDLSRARDVFRDAREVYSSTDRGLYVYPVSGPPRPTRLGVSAGLPSDDVLAARRLPDGTLAVLSARGLVGIDTDAVNGAPTREIPAPPLGELTDIEVHDDSLYACGAHGVARLATPSWEWDALSDVPPADTPCAALVPGRDDTLWVLGETTITQWVGDELREHRPPAFPRGRPRALGEDEAGHVYVLLERDDRALLARYDGAAWWTYALRDLLTGDDERVVGLVAQAGVPLLLTDGAAYAVSARARGATELPAVEEHRGRPLRYRATPRAPRGTAPPSVSARHPRSTALEPATSGSEPIEAAPRLFARRLPSPGGVVEAGFVTHGVVYLALRGQGLLEVSETRRPLSAGDFRELRPLALAIDARGGTWLRADDGSLVRLEGDVARTFPHGRVSALLESQDASGAAWAAEPWAALMDARGEALLVSPTPAGWVERARLSADAALSDVRLGVRTQGDHLWLFAHGTRAEWSRGSGLVYRGPTGAWVFVDVPLEPRGALEAVTHLVIADAVAYVAGPAGLARVEASGAAEVLYAEPVTDLERRGGRVLFVSHGNLYGLDAGDPSGTRPRVLRFEEQGAEALHRVSATGLALGEMAACVVGEGGLACVRLGDDEAQPPPMRPWDLLSGAVTLHAHDVEPMQPGAWLARREGALFLVTPR